ncbi:adhesion G-protein coupled receptor F3 [Ctenodactylus gundi]
MGCPAAPWLLLARTVLLLGSAVTPAAQPVSTTGVQGQAGGGSRPQLDHSSGSGELVLASVYVHLELSDRSWPPAFSSAQIPPPASAASSPRNLTGLDLITECNVTHMGQSYCACLPGYQWNASVCSTHRLCPFYYQRPCSCLIFSHPDPGYCQFLPPVPGKLSPNCPLQRPGHTLNLTLHTSQEATDLRWLLRHPGKGKPRHLWQGTQVSLSPSEGQAALSIRHMSSHWAGEYISSFQAQGFRWWLRQVVQVPLQEAEVVQLPDRLSISCATNSGFQLSCCFPKTNLAYTASWSPGEGSQASLRRTSDSQCLVLDVRHCPAADTTYTCVLQSPHLPPLESPVNVTIIKDGDITCPEDFSAVAWNITKAGYVAQVPCPGNKTGVVKRSCRPDGVWGPVQHDCIDMGILALYTEAKLLWEGQGRPREAVPGILGQLQQAVGVASSPSDLRALLHTMRLLANVVTNSRTLLNCSTLENLLKITDKVLDANTSSLWALAQTQKPLMGSHFLSAVETLVCSLSPEDHPYSFNSSNVLLESQLLEATFPDDYRISFSTQPPLQAQIPRSSLAPLFDGATNVSVTSLVLQNLDDLLPSNYRKGQDNTQYVTPGLVFIISIVADGQVFTQAQVIIDFGDTGDTLYCVFWDHSLFQGEGGWSDRGCQAQLASNSLARQCICQHLTTFSILMARHTVPKDPVLDLLTEVGLGTSILALLVCLGVYRLVWRVVVRNKVAFFRHAALFNMVICLLAADSCFLGSLFLTPQPHSPLCLAVIFLCHFFYLATFFWMLAQALVLAHQLLFVFHQLSKHIVFSLMVILGYLCPLGFAGTILGLYLPRGQYAMERECWLNEKGVVRYTFMGPVLAIVGMNGLVLTTVVLKLLRPSLSEGPPAEKRQALLGVLKALLVLTPVFGLTWGLGLATLFVNDSIVPHYVFTALNSFQGVFILLFGCLTDKKVREALCKRFCHPQVPHSAISLVSCWP